MIDINTTETLINVKNFPGSRGKFPEKREIQKAKFPGKFSAPISREETLVTQQDTKIYITLCITSTKMIEWGGRIRTHSGSILYGLVAPKTMEGILVVFDIISFRIH